MVFSLYICVYYQFTCRISVKHVAGFSLNPLERRTAGKIFVLILKINRVKGFSDRLVFVCSNINHATLAVDLNTPRNLLIPFVCVDQLLFRDRFFHPSRAQFSHFKTNFNALWLARDIHIRTMSFVIGWKLNNGFLWRFVHVAGKNLILIAKWINSLRKVAL